LPWYGSTIDPSDSRRAIVHREVAPLQVGLDRCRRVDDDLEVVTGTVETSRRAVPARSRQVRACAPWHPRIEADADRATRDHESSARPYGASAAPRPPMSTPVTRKSASFASCPSSPSRTARRRRASSRAATTYSSTALDEGDRLDLDERARRQLGQHFDGRAGGGVEPTCFAYTLLILAKSSSPEEHGRLHEPVERAAGFLEDCAQVRKHLFGLRADLPAHQVLLARLRASWPETNTKPFALIACE
jgi:hypothetical protein